MSLNDEIESFSKRREFALNKKDNEFDDDEWEEDWEDDEEDYASLEFKVYKLDELDKLNREIKELEELIFPWWKNLKVLVSKSTSEKIGLITVKKKHLLSDDKFDRIQIADIEKSLAELKIFEEILASAYFRHFKLKIYGLLSYIPFVYWSAWSTIWYFLIGWSLFDMGLRYFKYTKEKEWIVKAENFIQSQSDKDIVVKKETSKIEDVLLFNKIVSKQENEHWSIKVYDAVANIFTRNK